MSGARPDQFDLDALREELEEKHGEQLHHYWSIVEALAERVADPDKAKSKCAYCANDATCVGFGEAVENVNFACDEHCGHGNEDGRCVFLSEES